MNAHEELLARIRFVRCHWRLRSLVKGIAFLSCLATGLLVLGVWGADLFGFSPIAVWTARFATGGSIAFVAVRFVYLPLRRRISDVQVAQFIEERYPQLQDRLVAAVEYGDSTVRSGMIDLVIRDALDKSEKIDFSVFAEIRTVFSHGAAAAMSLLALSALLVWGPPFLPYGFERLYVPWAEAAGPATMAIEVTPGNSDINRGADQQIRARLVGFDARDVGLFSQADGATAWIPAAMDPEPRGNGFVYLLVDIQASLRYYVEAGGVKSPVHLLRVIDRPGVMRIDLTYNFPSYTGMEKQVVENEGDIAALKGTRVDLRVHLNRSASSAQLLLDDGSKIDLSRAGEMDFAASITIGRSGSYVIRLATASAGAYAASPEYTIEALDDAPPGVSIIRPMRDLKATNVEEVFTEVQADDDIGLGKLELRYSVNGGPEKAATLFAAKPPISRITGSHTFFLEELNLQPGDIISYYGKAWDNNTLNGPKTSSSDMYFIEVRPFEQRYVQSQQGAMPGGEGGAEEALSRQQRDIIAATFRLIRDGDSMDAKEYRDGMKSLALVQTRLQVQAQGIVDRMRRRGAASLDDNFSRLSEYLRNAVAAMGSAAIQLGAQKSKEALPEEQKALQQLMRAESLFREIQISFGSQSRQGSQENAEDLADLFELELNKLKNQYETIQSGEERARDQQLDEAMQRLKELARRQQQLNERSLRLGRMGRPGSSLSGAGQGQQQLLEEAARLQRQLQRLSRERKSPDMDRAGRQLRQATDEMKRALERTKRGEDQAAAAGGIRALQKLEDASRGLDGAQDSGLGKRLDRAVEESRSLLEEQNRIADNVERLRQESRQSDLRGTEQRRDEITGRNSALAGRLRSLADQIDDMARQARATRKETSSRLAEAGSTIRDRKLPERILNLGQLLQNDLFDFAKAREEYIRAGLEELNRQVESARNSIGQSREGRLEEAYAKTRQLAEGLESMQQRLHGQEEQQPSGGRGSGGIEKRQGENAKGSHAGARRELSGTTAGLPTDIGSHRDDEARQLRREFEQRLMDAEELRRLLDRGATRTENLDEVISALRLMQGTRSYDGKDERERLRSAIDLLRQIELDLGRELGRLAGTGQYQQVDDSEAPRDYRKLVEEYYKTLARGRQ